MEEWDMKAEDYIRGKHIPIWTDQAITTPFPQLEGNRETEVAVIGGGIAGIMTAYYLTRSGVRTTVVESNRVGSGVTGKSTAHVSVAHDVMYADMVKSHSGEKARIYARANMWAIEEMDSLTKAYGIDCQCYRNSEYIYATDYKQKEVLRREYETTRLLGLPTRWTEKVYLPFMTNGAICYEQQAQFNPRTFLACLATRIAGGGGRIYEESRVIKMDGEGPYVLYTKEGMLKARKVVVASHFPVIDKGDYFAKLEPWRSYVLGIKVRDKMGLDMFDSNEQPTHYIRSHPVGDGLEILVGGESHRVGTINKTDECYLKLAEYCLSHFQVESFDYYWSTQDLYPPDGIPYIGRMDKDWDGLYVATGFKGWGMTHGIVAGKVLCDLINNKKNEWSELYDPTGRELSPQAIKLIEHNLKTASEAVKGRMQNRGKMSELKDGEAGVFRTKDGQVAVYRDLNGSEHRLKASCSHMGCTVNWNKAEESWDCPCHGSRFDKEGRVIRGPAVEDLSNTD